MDLFVFAKRAGKWKPAGRYGSAVLPGREASFFSLRFFPLSKDTASLSIPVFLLPFSFLFFLSLLLLIFLSAAVLLLHIFVF